ncbi:MAG TPA: GntR family transcriptional regulator [Ilumatobacter sp.]|nr:GntR family transcriptional regulator [Ilumatobacter sp.]
MPVPDHRKASEHVAQRLRIEIADGTLQPGDMLPPEADLMAKLGVGRPTLREALRLLESEGLARVQRGNVGGVRIEAPDRGILARYSSLHLAMAGTSLAQVFAARDVLELEAVRLVARARGSGTWDILAATVEEELACGDDAEAYGVLHDRFHAELMDGCGNPALDLMWHTLDEVVGRHRSRFVSARAGNAGLEATSVRAAREGRRAHQWLVTLLRARSTDEAERAWTRHLESSRALLLSDDATGGCIDLLD